MTIGKYEIDIVNTAGFYEEDAKMIFITSEDNRFEEKAMKEIAERYTNGNYEIRFEDKYIPTMIIEQ